MFRCERSGTPNHARGKWILACLGKSRFFPVGMVLACWSLTAFAQARQADTQVRLPMVDGTDLRFARITFGQGPSHMEVDAILQDDQGFLWFGAQNGLKRFDGYSIREFRSEPNDLNSPTGSYANELLKDGSGKIWVSYDTGGLDRYDPNTEKFTHYTDGYGQSPWIVTHLYQDREGMMWLCTDNGLESLDPKSGQIVRYQHKPNDPESLSSDRTKSTFEERDGTFWVATSNSLDVFDRHAHKVIERIPLPPNLAKTDPNPRLLILFCEDHAQVLWAIFNYGYGYRLARVDRGARKLLFYVLMESGIGSPVRNGIRAILEDREGNLWLGTFRGGLLRIDSQRQEVVRYRNHPNDPESIPTDDVNALFEDREGNIWVGTVDGGVCHFPDRAPPFRRFRHVPGNPNSLDEDHTSAVYEDSRGSLWVGSRTALTRINLRTGEYKFYRNAGRPGELSSTWIDAIVEDRSGYLWFGTLGEGLDRFDPKTGYVQVYRHNPKDPRSLSHDTVRSLFVDRRGTLWVGTFAGLNHLNADGKFQVYQSEGLTEIRSIAEDRNGNIWAGAGIDGVHRLDPATGQQTVYRHSRAPGSLSSNSVNQAFLDRSGNLWVATENGLNKFDAAHGAFRVFTQRDGICNRNINNILQDDHGDLWLATSDGLSRFDPVKETFRNYYVADGLLGNEFYNYASAYRNPQGEMFFGSYAGVISFLPENVKDNPYVPPVVLTDFNLSGHPVPIGKQSPLKQSIPVTDSLTLSHTQNIFSLQFSALSYANPEKNRYRYRLEGLESAWNDADSTRRMATYTTLPPGHYVFYVQGSNDRGVWNQSGVSLRIWILPPWWSTWWFRTALGALILVLLWALYQLRIRQLQRQERKSREAIETIPAMAFTVLSDGSRTFVNRRWVEYTGLSVEQAAGLGWPAAVHPDDVNRVLEKWRMSVASGEPLEYEARFRGADGEYRWFQGRAVPLRDERGNILRWYGVMTDIEDRKQADEALRKAQAELAHVTRIMTMGELAASIAHEVNQPLSGVVVNGNACLRWLAGDSPNLDEAREAVRRIVRDGKRAGDVIARIRALATKTAPAKERLDLNEAIREVVALAGDELRKNSVAVRAELAADLLPVLGDRVQLQQVVLNLVMNGVEAMSGVEEQPRELIVRTQNEDNGQVRVTVQDSGIGLDPESMERIFDAFYTTKQGGMGMGLSISRSIIQNHGGKLWAVANEGPGMSVQFTIPKYQQ